MANTIFLEAHRKPKMMERLAATATILPGHCCNVRAAATTVTEYDSAASTDVFLTVAVENTFRGQDIDDLYTDGESVQLWVPESGDLMNLLVEANAAAIVYGDAIEVSTNGGVQKLDSTGEVIGYAEEAVDNSSTATQTRIKVRRK